MLALAFHCQRTGTIPGWPNGGWHTLLESNGIGQIKVDTIVWLALESLLGPERSFGPQKAQVFGTLGVGWNHGIPILVDIHGKGLPGKP